MNQRRKFLVTGLGICLVIALAAIATPFALSLLPSERTLADLPRIHIPELKPGEFIFTSDPTELTNWPSVLLILRQPNGRLMVWRIPKQDGAYAMPDTHWWRPGYKCMKFEPNFIENTISCRDSKLDPWFKDAFRWSLDGKNLSGEVDNMPVAKGTEDHGDYFLRK
jgi:hypothetical protein